MSLLFVGSGFYFLGQAVPSIAKLSWILLQDEAMQLRYNGKDTYELAATSVLYLVLSVVFIVGAGGLKDLVLSLRRTGTGTQKDDAV